MALNTFHFVFKENSPLVEGATVPPAQGSFILNSRVECYTNFGMQVVTTGGASYSMQLEGSLDGTNWFLIGSPVTSDGVYSQAGAGNYTAWVRLNITSVVGGTSPECTVSAVAID